jgi:hypothetical protein
MERREKSSVDNNLMYQINKPRRRVDEIIYRNGIKIL